MPIFGGGSNNRFPTLEEMLRGDVQFDPTMSMGTDYPALGISVPDYAGQINQMVAQNQPAAESPAPKKRGLFSKGGFIRDVLGDTIGGFGDALSHNNNYGKMNAAASEDRLEAKREAEKMAPFYAAVDQLPNLTPQERAIIKANPKAFTENWAQQYGSKNVNKGDSLVRGVGGGQYETYMAPQVNEVGDNLILVDPQHRVTASADSLANPDVDPSAEPTAPPIASTIYQGRSEMENYASQFGEPGSPEWKAAIQDFRLRGAGPTGYYYKDQLQDQRLNQSDTNNRRTTSTSAANNVRTTNTSAANNVRTTSTSAGNNARTNQTRVATARGRGGYRGGETPEGTIIRNPTTGQRMKMQGGRWVAIGG